MSSLTWKHDEDLPYIVYGTATERHQLGVCGDRIRVKLFRRQQVPEFALTAFVDYVLRLGQAAQGVEPATRLSLKSDEAGQECWIGFTKDRVIVKDPASKSRRALNFEGIRDAVAFLATASGGRP